LVIAVAVGREARARLSERVVPHRVVDRVDDAVVAVIASVVLTLRVRISSRGA
jgi:hypothetical protein